MWAIWWAWMAGALVLVILEIFAPGFILLGFAIGAAIVGLLLLVGGPLGAFLAGSLPLTAVVFAIFSLLGWLFLRRIVGVRDGQSKIINRDINED